MKQKVFWTGFLMALGGVLWLYWRGAEAERQREQRYAPPPRPAAAPAVAPPVPPAPDPLTELSGIGPVYALRLQEAGVNTFGQLAALSADQIRAIIGLKPWQGNVLSWIEQAKARAA